MQFTRWECIYRTVRIALNYFKKRNSSVLCKIGKKTLYHGCQDLNPLSHLVIYLLGDRRYPTITVNFACRATYFEKFFIIIFRNSLSGMFFLACIKLAASSPTEYLSCGFSEVTACSVTLATSSGGDDNSLSIIDLKLSFSF